MGEILMHVNLLPPELVSQSRLIRVTKNWGLAIAVWAVTLVALSAPLTIQSFKLQQDLERLNKDVAAVRLKESKTQQIRVITADVQKRTQRIRAVLPPNRIPSLLGIFGKTFQSDDSPIALQDFQVSIQSESKASGSSGSTPGGKPVAEKKPSGAFTTQIVARGYTGNSPTVAEVVQRLEEFGVFQSILLKSARDSIVDNQQVDEFELECTYVE
jgi:hypothetical protein